MRLSAYASLLSIALAVLPLPSHAIDTVAKQAVVVDSDTDTVLLEKNAFEQMYPASMTKLMTTYIVFDRLKSGALKLDDTFRVSEEAWRKGGSKMFVKVNDAVTVDDLLHGIIVQSGNDACIVVAEGIAGTEEAFADLMNEYAKKLGLNNSHFKNSTGWPDEEHVVSPHDLAVLSERLIEDFPEYYPMFALEEFTYQGITQPNRNWLLQRNDTVDGLKTGHTEASGYGIVISGVNKEDQRRIIVVVNGLNSEKERADEAEKLLLYGYRNFTNMPLWKAGEVVKEVPTWYGVDARVGLTPGKDVIVNLPKSKRDEVKLTVNYEGPIAAPIAKGDQLGELLIEAPDRKPRTIPLYAATDVEKLGAAQRIWPNLRHMLFGGVKLD